jgi:hypothetical protein
LFGAAENKQHLKQINVQSSLIFGVSDDVLAAFGNGACDNTCRRWTKDKRNEKIKLQKDNKPH